MTAFERRDGADGGFRAPRATVRVRGAHRALDPLHRLGRQAMPHGPDRLPSDSLPISRQPRWSFARFAPGCSLGFSCRPISGASRGTRVTAPGAASRVLRKLAGAGGILVLDGDGCVYQPASCDLTSEFHEIWVTYETIRDVDAEIVSWFTSALPRHKGQAPRSIVVRCCCRGGRCQQNRCSHVDKGKVFHAKSSHSCS